MIFATATWSWSQFSVLSLFVIAPIWFLIFPRLRADVLSQCALAIMFAISILFAFIGYETKNPASPCPDLYQVGLGLFASAGILVSSLILLWTRFRWLIFIPILWLGYYAPPAISALISLWHESKLYQ